MLRTTCAILFGALLAGSVFAQPPSITTGDLTCLPVENNAEFTAAVAPEISGDQTLRLYFRRLNPVGSWYYHLMNPEGAGDYWTVFPRPEDREQPELSDEWWEVLKDRDWVAANGWSRDDLGDWLDDQENEAAEYYVAVVGPDAQVISRSDTMLVPVRKTCPSVDDIPDAWVRRERQWFSGSLTVGETTQIQRGRQVFHWLCDGIVSRIGVFCRGAGETETGGELGCSDPADVEEIVRPDDFCRACVVGLIPRVAPAVAAVGAGIVTVNITENASPSRPPVEP